MLREKYKKDITVQNTMLIVFVTLIVITVSLICFLIFSNWLSSSRNIIWNLAQETNTQILREVERFIYNALHVNENNHELIASRIVDLANEQERDKFFVNVLQAHGSEIYSFSFGTENGEYYGARRNEKGEIEIMRNNAQTGGHSWYYSVQADLTTGDLVVEAGEFDPRSREWYKAAKESGAPVFSPVYRHFVMPDLTISTAWPVYESNGELRGVLGTHMTLSAINKFLHEMLGSKNGYAVIAQKDTGELIANSFGQQNFIILQDGEMQRTRIEEIVNTGLIEAYRHYRDTSESDFTQSIPGDRLYMNFQEYTQNGLQWIVITAVPESLLNRDIVRSIRDTVITTFVLLILSVVLCFMVIRKMVKPIEVLIATAQKIADGDLSERVPIARNDELGIISASFNRMADTMSSLINNLEATVAERTAEIFYLSEHDPLTGLLNRYSLDETLKAIDTEDNLPISIIFADINGLKLTNDIFGHTAGDGLIKKSAEVIRKACRENDIITRVGGDEFILLLLHTGASEAEKIIARIKKGLLGEKVEAIKCSMALGTDTKTLISQNIDETLSNAEDAMYREKTLNRKANNSDTLNTIISTLHEINPEEKRHSIRVGEVCEIIARELELPETEVNKVKRAGYLHDIGKVVLKKELVENKRPLTDAEVYEIQQHTATSYRILNLFDDTLDIADAVYSHHEKWDGTGYPQGLKGQEIPLYSRIISLAETYDRRMHGVEVNNPKKMEAVIRYIRENKDKRFDPELAELFIEYLMRLDN